jgi:cytidylate kinase
MLPFPQIIAIDGPAASGKSTLGENLAKRLGYLYFDTGVMYRAITWLTLQNGIDPSNEDDVTQLARECQIDIQPPTIEDGRPNDVLVDGVDVTWDIRRPEVDANVSQVSSFPGVREALSEQQRRVGLRGKIVMVGRDIGTVVLPEADLKFYLDASAKERAKRRYLEITGRGDNANREQILKSMILRDQIDSTRQVAPLQIAKDAIVINSDELNQQQVMSIVMKIIQEKSA